MDACRFGVVTIAVAVVVSGALRAQDRESNWPQFRGVQARGIAEGSLTPENWERFKWKTPVPGLGLSSPVIWSNKVFITTAVSQKGEQELKIGLYGDIESAEVNVPHTSQIFCINKEIGAVLWKQVAHEVLPRMKRHPKSSQANCTPATDGTNLVCFFGFLLFASGAEALAKRFRPIGFRLLRRSRCPVGICEFTDHSRRHGDRAMRCAD